MQREMADKVIAAIEKKAKKGREEGSYKSLVRDYGRGVLIVGLPMWLRLILQTRWIHLWFLKIFVRV